MEWSVAGILFVIAWILLECKKELENTRVSVNTNLSYILATVVEIDEKLRKLEEIESKVDSIEYEQKKLEALEQLGHLDDIQTQVRHTKDYLEAISGAIHSKGNWGEWNIKLPWHYGK